MSVASLRLITFFTKSFTLLMCTTIDSPSRSAHEQPKAVKIAIPAVIYFFSRGICEEENIHTAAIGKITKEEVEWVIYANAQGDARNQRHYDELLSSTSLRC